MFFNALIVAVAVVGLHEYLSMSLPEGRILEKKLALGAGAVLTAVMSLGNPPLSLAALILVGLAFCVLFLFKFEDLSRVVHQLSLVLFGFIYVPLLLVHLCHLRGLEMGREWVFLVLLLVMASDTAAYFTGISIGKRRLYPAISPNKSVEGAIGGLAGSVLAAFAAKFWFLPILGFFDCLLLGVVLGAVGQVGDLFESMLKRSFGVKDSGAIVPGHGGILDRLDSLLFVFPLAYFYALLRFAA